MALNTKYVVGINLNDYFVNKDTGLPLSGGKIYFKKDNNRSVGKFVYRLTGSPPNYTYTALPNPITLSSVGTVGVSPTNATNIAVYFYPYDENGDLDLYYVQVTDSAGNIQLERQAWPNISANVNPLNQVSGDSDNQIANSQFIDILFQQEQGITFSWTGSITNRVFPIAPGWDLIVSASGDSAIEVNRIELAGSLNINTNPPYALDILPEGDAISSIKLRQTLQGNPSIFANNTLSGFMLIASLDGISHPISMSYSTSVPNVPKTIISADTGVAGYVNAVGTLDIGASLNTATPPDAATFIDIILPRTGHVALSSIQILPIMQGNDAASYIQDSVQRQESYLSYYYNPLIQQVPVPSVTQGWDFKVNPAQWGSTFTATTGPSHYVWDQTIVWQGADNLVSADANIDRQLQVTLATTGQFAVVQYLSAADMLTFLGDSWSALISAYTNNVLGAAGTLSFWYTTDVSLPDMTSNLSLILTMDANGRPATFNGNWTELPNPQLNKAKFTIPYAGSSDLSQKIALNGWERPAFSVPSVATYCAVVIGFASTTASNVTFDSIAVTPGLLARPFPPLSYALTLEQMKYYWEQSWIPNTQIPVAAAPNSIAIPCSSVPSSFSSISTILPPFQLPYQFKRAIPENTFYPTTGTQTAGNVNVFIYNRNSLQVSHTIALTSQYAVVNPSQYSTNYYTTAIEPQFLDDAPGATDGLFGILNFNFTCNARLGDV